MYTIIVVRCDFVYQYVIYTVVTSCEFSNIWNIAYIVHSRIFPVLWVCMQLVTKLGMLHCCLYNMTSILIHRCWNVNDLFVIAIMAWSIYNVILMVHHEPVLFQRPAPKLFACAPWSEVAMTTSLRTLVPRGCLLFAVGVFFALVLNLLQVQREVTLFPDVLDNLFSSAWWVPLACGSAAGKY